jgi:RNase H-fold protein (predicted Holliday junction resolvase)
MKIFCNKEEYFRSQTIDNLKNQIWLKGEWVLSGDNSRSRMEYSKQKDFSEEIHGQMINTLKEIISKRESDKIIVGKPARDDNAQVDSVHPEKVPSEVHDSDSVHAEDIGSGRIQPESAGVENVQGENELKEQVKAENELKIGDGSGHENELEINPEIVDKPDQETPNQPEIETKDQVMNDDNEHKELISKIDKEFLIEKDFSKKSVISGHSVE